MGYQIKGLDEKGCATPRYLAKYEPSRNGKGKLISSPLPSPSLHIPIVEFAVKPEGRGRKF